MQKTIEGFKRSDIKTSGARIVVATAAAGRHFC